MLLILDHNSGPNSPAFHNDPNPSSTLPYMASSSSSSSSYSSASASYSSVISSSANEEVTTAVIIDDHGPHQHRHRHRRRRSNLEDESGGRDLVVVSPMDPQAVFQAQPVVDHLFETDEVATKRFRSLSLSLIPG